MMFLLVLPVLLIFFNMGNVGIRFTPGYDAFTAPQSAERFNSKYGVLKAFKWGDLSYVNSPASVEHNLKYEPSFFGFRKIGSSAFSLLGAGSSLTGNSLDVTGNPEESYGVSIYTDATKLYVDVQEFLGFSKISATVRYYLFVDRAQQFTGEGGPVMNDRAGLRFVPAGKNVFTAKEYEVLFSTKYKIIQYYPESVKSDTLMLPVLFSSPLDLDNDEYTYVDFTHGFTFPPFFRAWYHTGDNVWKEIPYNEIGQYGELPNDSPFINYEISAACNEEKIRVLFKRRSIYTTGSEPYLSGIFSAQTITVLVIPYFVNLLEGAN